MNEVIAALDYAIDLAEKADARFHELTGKVDAYLHSTVERLKALREKLTATFSAGEAGAASACPCYESLSTSAKLEVEEMAAKIREAA